MCELASMASIEEINALLQEHKYELESDISSQIES